MRSPFIVQYVENRQSRMSDRKNATFADHDAATFDVSESLSICKQLLEHSWKQYNNKHYHLVWQDALDTAIEGCEGLLTLSTEKHVQDLEKEKHMWFVLFSYIHRNFPYCCMCTPVFDKHHENICISSQVSGIYMGI